MHNLVELHERPSPDKKYMIVGWRQWADAGSISSGLPAYLIDHTDAKKIGEIRSDGFYLFQIPGTHHLLRPEIKLNDGFPESLETTTNELFYTEIGEKGLFIFLGDEPHLNADQYAEAFFDIVNTLEIDRIVALGGVYDTKPYAKDRHVSCVYSLPQMKDELDKYATRFSNYEGGATISTYLVDRAEAEGVEFLAYYAFVPAYDLSSMSEQQHSINIEHDFKAWFDIMQRINYMFGLDIDLRDLKTESDELLSSMDAKIEDLARRMPEINVRDYMSMIEQEFNEMSFMPLGNFWEEELGDLFEDIED